MGRAVANKAASVSQTRLFETEELTAADNRAAQSDAAGHWIDRFHAATPCLDICTVYPKGLIGAQSGVNMPKTAF